MPRLPGAALWAALAASLLGPSLLLGQAPPPEAEETFLRFRYETAVDTLVPALYLRGTFYLPMGEVLSHLGVEHRVDPARRSVSGTYPRADIPYQIRFDSLRATMAGRELRLPDDSHLATDLEIFSSPSVLERVFGWRVMVDAGGLTLRVVSDRELPVAATQRNRRELALSRSATADTSAGVHLRRDRSVLQGAVIDYGLAAISHPGGADASFDVRLGAELLGGEVEGWIQGGDRDPPAQAHHSLRWRLVFEDGAALSQITLGRIHSAGLRPEAIDGVEISNRPVQPRRSLGTQVIDGESEPGWEVEVYLSGRFVGTTRADSLGYYRLAIPLTYGTSSLELRHYGPGGRLQTEVRTVHVPFNIVPAGAMEYSVAFGRTEWDGSRALQGQLAVGISEALSNTVGLEQRGDSAGRGPILYDDLSLRVSPNLMVGLHMAPAAYHRGSVEAFFPTDLRLSASFSRYTRAGWANPLGLRSQTRVHGFVPLHSAGIPVRMLVMAEQRTSTTGRKEMDGGLELMATRSRVHSSLGYRWRKELTGVRHQLRLGGTVFSPFGRRTVDWIRGLLLRGSLEYDPGAGRARLLDLQASSLVRPGRRIEIAFTRDMLFAQTRLEARLLVDLAQLRSTTSIRGAMEGGGLSQLVQGGIRLDPSQGRIGFSNRPLVGRGSATLRMFLDENGSGSYDPGEELLPDADVRFEPSATVQRSGKGLVTATDLHAYTRYRVSIGAGSIPNPLWVPELTSVALVAAPNRGQTIDIPFHSSGLVEGQVVRRTPEKEMPLAGVKLHVRSRDGSYVTTIATFGDGIFHQMGIPPGQYVVEVDSGQLELLDAVAVPARHSIEVQRSRDGSVLDGLNFLLVPR